MASNAQSRSRRDHELWDAKVNELWNKQRPKLSPEETIAAAKKLYRHAMGKPWRGEWAVTTGRRHTWPRYGRGPKGKWTFYVNHESGLRENIHLISHYCHRKLHPQDKPHSIRQLRLEAKLTKFALARRWHEGTLKKQPKPEAPAPAEQPKPDKVLLRYRRMVTRRDRWARELERSKRLHDKAQREVRAYERRHRERIAAN